VSAPWLVPLLGVPPPGCQGRGLVLVSPAPRHLAVVFQGLARPRFGASLPAVVPHKRHRGGNSTPLDIPVAVAGDRSGPVTEIQRRIGVTVHQRPTSGAVPHSLPQPEIGPVTAAATVGLGRRKPPIGDRKPAALPWALVGQQRPNLTDAGLCDASAKRSTAHPAGHRGDVEILDHDRAVAAGELGGEGVELVSAAGLPLAGQAPPAWRSPGGGLGSRRSGGSAAGRPGDAVGALQPMAQDGRWAGSCCHCGR
jgi:hypothetical protein